VFHPTRLSRDKFYQIAEEPRFSSQKHYYFKLKKILEFQSEITPDIRSKLAAKISLYRPQNNYILKPMSESKGNRESIPVSILEVKNLFSDEGHNFFAKKVIKEDKTILYLLSSDVHLIKNFKVTLFPEKFTFHQRDNSHPLIIESSEAIESIMIELEDEDQKD
jgi:hypothetical protein